MQKRSLSRVVWSEGMHLAQHHFQAQSRFFEDTTAFTVSSLFFRSYGFASLELDRESLLNGTVSLTHARGILPDGLGFHFPHDPPPEPLPLRDRFSPTQESHVVLLALPSYRPGAANCAPDDGSDRGPYRYVPLREEVSDEVSGEEHNPVALAGKNFRLLLASDDAEGLVSLPVARIRRDGSGNFVYDDTFMPPAVRIGAAQPLVEMLDRLVGMLEAKAESLATQRGPGGIEVAELWLAHAVHAGLPVLRHHRAALGAHPEEVYAEVARLAGALSTFSLDADAATLPLYDHADLGGCFGALERAIRERLEVVLPSGPLRIPLEASDEGLYTASIHDRRAMEGGEWYLGVRSSVGDAEVISSTPRLVKICSARHIVRLVKEAFPGLELAHVPVPPTEVRARPGTHYFHVGRTEPCWASIVDTAEVGVYAPAALADAVLELVVVPAGA